MSDEANPGVPPQSQSNLPAPTLRPEIQPARADRGLLAMLMMICTLGGAGFGFGLATLRMDLRMMRMQRYEHGGCPNHRPNAMAAYGYTHTWLGVRIGGREDLDGVTVSEVTPQSPADVVGLRVGDVIRSVNGGNVMRTPTDLVTTIRGHEPGELVSLEIVRGEDGSVANIAVRLSVHTDRE
jgi:S1-C subfamily serine protease